MIQQQQAYLLELYRTGMRTMSDLTRASLESTQRLHSQQADAVRDALEENARAARELSDVRSLDQMIALQTRVASEQMQRSADAWSRLWRTASESQAAMIGQVQAFASRAGEETARFGATQASQAANTAQQAMNHERKERKSA